MVYNFHCDMRLTSDRDSIGEITDYRSTNLSGGIDRVLHEMMNSLHTLCDELKERPEFLQGEATPMRLVAHLLVKEVFTQRIEVDVSDFHSILVYRSLLDTDYLREALLTVLFSMRKCARQQLSSIPANRNIA